jgi:rubredoxin
MATERCEHGNSAPPEMYNQLHDSQAGAGRHKCIVCAYQTGYERGLKHSDLPAGDTDHCQQGVHAPSSALSDLPESQAGAGRHQCAICAYDFGFRRGRAEAAAAR